MVSTQAALGEFLHARRAELDAADKPGTTTGLGRRRVPGLRREEVAARAGMSADYYARIEQGRAGQVSTAVLEALAGALELSTEQRAHLFALALPWSGPDHETVDGDELTALRTFIGLTAVPAAVLDRRLDLLATNTLFDALITPEPLPRNLARFVLLDPAAHELIADWPTAAQGTLSRLRFQAARHPDDQVLTRLVEELVAGSDWVAANWPAAAMDGLRGGPGEFAHDRMGRYRFRLVVLDVPAGADLTVLAWVPSDESSSTALEGLRAGPPG